jgi:hypothetical protein
MRHLVILLAVAACSSSYIPQTRGRVAMIMQHGGPAYVRDGEIIRHGFLGSGLVRAVAGNPGAEHAAHEYRSRLGWGLFYGLGGLVCSTVSMVVAIDSAVDSESGAGVPTGVWVSLGCLVASFAGFGYLATAEPYRYDAINIFNDTGAAPQLPQETGPPGWSTKRETLRMR